MVPRSLFLFYFSLMMLTLVIGFNGRSLASTSFFRSSPQFTESEPFTFEDPTMNYVGSAYFLAPDWNTAMGYCRLQGLDRVSSMSEAPIDADQSSVGVMTSSGNFVGLSNSYSTRIKLIRCSLDPSRWAELINESVIPIAF